MRPGPPARPVAVLHPETVEVPAFRAQVQAAFRDVGWPAPRWVETSLDDAGHGLTQQALADGADLLLACGGDGTVRAVATALAGTGVPVAVLPTGTGNLLARNLGVPQHLAGALDVVLTGTDVLLDLGRTEVTCFAVMAGIGLDAAMVRDAPPGLKKAWGWPAYVLSGARHLPDRSVRLRLRVDDGPWSTRRVRALVVGNVGELQAGAALLPSADPADGVLDLVLVSARSPLDWARVAARVLLRSDREDRLLARTPFRRLEVESDRPVPHEVDGDPVGDVTRLVVEVAPGALTVRVAA